MGERLRDIKTRGGKIASDLVPGFLRMGSLTIIIRRMTRPIILGICDQRLNSGEETCVAKIAEDKESKINAIAFQKTFRFFSTDAVSK